MKDEGVPWYRTPVALPVLVRSSYLVRSRVLKTKISD